MLLIGLFDELVNLGLESDLLTSFTAGKYCFVATDQFASGESNALSFLTLPYEHSQRLPSLRSDRTSDKGFPFIVY